MIHFIEKLDNFIIIDVESGSIFSVDRSAFLTAKSVFGKLDKKEQTEFEALPEETVKSCTEELNGLKAEGVLDSALSNTCGESKPVEFVTKAMCLNVSHNCNLRCKYCFADEGKYSGKACNMSIKTAIAAIDLLIKSGKNRRNLEVDFFGGEPLLNMPVVKAVVDYARAREKDTGKRFKFTMTTNAVLLDDETINYLDKTMDNIVLSIDGRENVHNHMRPSSNGGATFKTALDNSLKIKNLRKGKKDYYVRGTFTAANLDFSNDVIALNDSGFDQISLEPVVLPEAHPLSIKTEHLRQLKDEYQKLSDEYVLRRKSDDKYFNFFHFNFDIYGGPCEHKRLTGCGAGSEYLAVSADGGLYPCHQFVGNPDYLLGSVCEGITRKEISEKFLKTSIKTKPDCMRCWAKYYCSGGCNANAINFTGDINKPHPVLCELMRERVECAIAINVVESILQ